MSTSRTNATDDSKISESHVARRGQSRSPPGDGPGDGMPGRSSEASLGRTAFHTGREASPDPADAAVVKLLLLAVDQEELRSRLTQDESDLSESTATYQAKIVGIRSVNERLMRNGDVAVLPVIQHNTAWMQALEAEVEENHALLQSVQWRKPRAAVAQQRVLKKLYAGAQGFNDRRLIPETQLVSGTAYPDDFCLAFASLASYATGLAEEESQLSALRGEAIKASSALQGENFAGFGPYARDAVINPAQTRLRAQRETAYCRYESKLRTISIQRTLLGERQQAFFLDVARPLLVTADMLPAPAAPVGTSSGGSLSLISRYFSCGESWNSSSHSASSVLDTVTNESSSVEEHDEYDDDGMMQPSTESVRHARRQAAQASRGLNSLRQIHTDGVVRLLSTYTNAGQCTYDSFYEQTTGDITFAEVEARAMHGLLHADANYSFVRSNAARAGITESLPLSPVILASWSEAGHLSCAGTDWEEDERQHAEKKQRSARKWARRVARGEPVTERLPSRDVSLTSVRSRRPSQPWPDGTPVVPWLGRHQRQSSVKSYSGRTGAADRLG